ncbi:mucin [Colletotrichum scovillei]|nr:mucin [Colletotrichum scovillei]KAF4780894.1 mucin [Colletotrichum scovillei]KXH38664.1 mucin [Colletotrichum nymphaeae SA-01]
MPYNTRRKSLSLPSLGIHVPGSHPSRSSATAAPSRSNSENGGNRVTITSTTIARPSKRQKRSHGDGTVQGPTSQKHTGDAVVFDHTPPPSPTRSNVEMQESHSDSESAPHMKIEGINDEIVEATIAQLQATCNRPHLVRELATVLSQQIPIVKNSANPCAIVSSRLSAYLKRSCWSGRVPCPMAKELEKIHPRRTYFYLTTRPRLPFPDSPAFAQRAVISPSLSSIASGSEDGDDIDLRRRDLSPSPEVDLSSPEFDDGDDDFAMPTTPVGSLPSSFRYSRSQRSASPPLEKDEREFTQTADGLQKRKLARELSLSGNGEQSTNAYEPARDDGMFDERTGVAVNSGLANMHQFMTSPAFKATVPASARKESDGDSWFKLGGLLEWDHSPESIELDELDCLLDSC